MKLIFLFGFLTIMSCGGLMKAQSYPQIRLNEGVVSRADIMQIECFEHKIDSNGIASRRRLYEKLIIYTGKQSVLLLRYSDGDSIRPRDSISYSVKQYCRTIEISPEKIVEKDSLGRIVKVMTVMRGDTIGYSGQSDPSFPLDSDPSFSTPIFSLITAA